MPLSGKVLLPREFAAYAAAEWPGDELPKAVATGMAESALYVGAYHDNVAADGKTVTSRDCGIMEINIDAVLIGSGIEAMFRTDSVEFADYDPVVKASVKRARDLFNEPWSRPNKDLPQTRRWEPWVAYTEGWATFPAWWAWDSIHKLWHPTGRYIQKAIVGCANYHLLIVKDKDEAAALAYAQTQQERFEIPGVLDIRSGQVHWHSFPTKPTDPPADGHGPRPVPNHGI